jgi:hypothetical protein
MAGSGWLLRGSTLAAFVRILCVLQKENHEEYVLKLGAEEQEP